MTRFYSVTSWSLMALAMVLLFVAVSGVGR